MQVWIWQYDSGYLTRSKKLTGSQLSLPQGINKKLKCETKNKMTSVTGPVQSSPIIWTDRSQQISTNVQI